MKALTIRQPWAWLITRPDLNAQAHAEALAAGQIKTIENRSWATKMRGQFLIHAAAGMTHPEYLQVLDFLDRQPGLRRIRHAVPMPRSTDLKRGGIVGVAELVDCVTASDSPYFFGPFGFVLVNVRPVPFVPCKGALGFWNVPPEVANEVDACR